MTADVYIVYVATWSGFIYVAFIIGVFSRKIIGLVHHSCMKCQFFSIRYSERLAQVGVIASVGSHSDSYDNALAETINGLYKTGVIRRKGPWKIVDDVEYATLEWVDWFNNRRLLEPIGYIPPAEYEANYWRGIDRNDTAGLKQARLH